MQVTVDFKWETSYEFVLCEMLDNIQSDKKKGLRTYVTAGHKIDRYSHRTCFWQGGLERNDHSMANTRPGSQALWLAVRNKN